MSKKKYSTNPNIVPKEIIEENKIEEVVLENAETEKKVETFSQETEPSKTEENKIVISKQKGKIIALNQTNIVVRLQNGIKKTVKRPDYSVKWGDVIEL